MLLANADKVSPRKDIPAFCKQTQGELARQEEENGLSKFWIRKPV